ncbi:Imm1 family immunity protein [Archangium gephyra]|uniref:Imm1 family immunity protein n=1 Tax=Archangium gephyra TaxID=48 RepID=UPI0035D431AE
MAVQYLGPRLEQADNPSLAFIEELLRNRGKEYWRAGSATATLSFDAEAGGSPQLTIIVEQPHGVLLQYSPPGGMDEYLLTDPTVSSKEQVVTYPGGNEWVVPRRYLVSVERALEVIQAFLEDGRREGSKWIVLGGEEDDSSY